MPTAIIKQLNPNILFMDKHPVIYALLNYMLFHVKITLIP